MQKKSFLKRWMKNMRILIDTNIITRDRENGFKNSPVKTIAPEKFLKLRNKI